jgi:SAM-dependent methyltransferase
VEGEWLPVPHGLLALLEAREPVGRVLDFGCGFGRSTEALLHRGYDAWGVDISAAEVAKAPAEFRERLAVLDERGRSPYDDASFAVIYSQQVFEHVADLEQTVAEITRLTAPGGIGVHGWPGKWQPMEHHLMMPVVHWLPKNQTRRVAIHMFTRLGFRPPWPPELESRKLSDLSEFEYRYSVDHTFYRPFRVVAAEFAKHGLEVWPLPHPRLAGRELGVAQPLAEWAVRTFATATLVTQTPT